MPEQHLLFISAGEHVHETLPACIKNLKEITHVIVVVEKSVYHDLPDDRDRTNSAKPQIREAIQGVKAICDSMNIAFSEIRTEDTRINAIRDAVLAVTRQHPAAHISFNLSGGTKMLSLSLFIMALWLDAQVYLTPRNDQIEQILIPQMHLDEIRRNPNYPEALKILSDAPAGWMTRQDFAMEFTYKPSRLPGDEKTKRTPNRGTITRILQQLIDWGLIEESFCDRSKKAKQYRLTPHGEFAQKMLRAEGGNGAPEQR